MEAYFGILADLAQLSTMESILKHSKRRTPSLQELTAFSSRVIYVLAFSRRRGKEKLVSHGPIDRDHGSNRKK